MLRMMTREGMATLSVLTPQDFARFAAMTDEAIAADCEVETFHAHGPGGQGVNTADSAVRMRHIPTGIAVTSREERSQLQNRRRCVEKLRELFARRSHVATPRKATKPSKAAAKRRLEDKRRRSEIKRLRGRPDAE